MESYEDEYNLCESIELLSDDDLLNVFDNELYKIFIYEMTKYPVATMESNEKYYNDYCNGDLNAKEMLINTNLRLVVNIVNKYKDRIVNLQPLDLIQEGVIGLVRALDSYDSKLGAFSTHAFIRIRGAVLRAILNKEKIIRQSVDHQTEISRYLKIISKYQKENKPLPSNNELCEILGITEEKLKDVVDGAKFSVVSINKIIDEEDNKTEFGDIIPDLTSNKIDEIFENIESHNIYVVLQEILSPIQYFIVYYHILAENKMTLDKIGKYFEVTRERIRLIEEDAKNIIKNVLPIDSFQFGNILEKVKQREGKKFYQIREEPISPIQIIKYMYMKDNLTLREQLYFLLKYLSDYKYSEDDIVRFFSLTNKEYLEFVRNLREKTNYIFSDLKKFRKFKKQMLNTYKTGILNALQNDQSTGHVIDYAYFAKKYALFNYERFYNRFGGVLSVLTGKEKDLLYAFLDETSLRSFNQEDGEQIALMNDDSFKPVWEIFDKLEQKRLEVKSYGVIKRLKL